MKPNPRIHRNRPTLYWYLFKHPFARIYRNRILTFIGLTIVLVGAYLLVSSQNQKTKTPRETRSTITTAGLKPISDYKLPEILNSGDIDLMFEYIKHLRVGLVQAPLTVQVTRLQQSVEVSEKMLKMSQINREQKDLAVAAQLDGLTLLDVLNMAHGLNQDIHRRKVRELANQHIDDKNINVRRKASLGLALVSASDYITDSTSVKFQELKTQLSSAASSVGDDAISIISLEKIGDILFSNIDQSQSVEIYQLLLDEISRNQAALPDDIQPIAKLVTTNLANKIAFVDVKFDRMVHEIDIGSPTVIEGVKSFVQRIDNNPLITANNYSRAIQLVELLYQTTHASVVPELVAQLDRASNQLSDEENRKLTRQLIDDAKKRINMLGKPIHIAGSGLRGEDLRQLENRVILIAFYGTTSPELASPLYAVAELDHLVSKGVSFVCLTGEKDKANVEAAAENLTSGTFVFGEAADQIFSQFPVTRYPYFVILDRDHNLIHINPAVHQLRKLLRSAVNAGS